MTPQSRFTIFHSSLPVEGLVVKDPIGWDTVVLSLERHKDYHSLFEYFKGTFMWYGEAMQILKTIEKDFGINAYVRLEIDLSYKSGVWVNIYEGKIELPQLEEVMIADKAQYKMTVPIVQDDFITKFLNRQDSQVDLQATVDLDGNTRTAVNKIVLPMPSQKIQSRFKRTINYDPPFYPSGAISVPAAGLSYLMFTNSRNDIDEVEQRFDYNTEISSLNPTDVSKYILKAKYDGSYNLNTVIKYTIIFNAALNADVKWFYALRQSGVLTVTQIGTTSSIAGGIQMFENGSESVNVNFDLLAGDEVYIYGTLDVSVNATANYFADYDTDPGPAIVPAYTSLEITASTTYKETTTDAYLIKDAAEAILSKLVGQNSAVKSTYLSTCLGRNAIFRGKHVRGYDFATKQFSMSFEEWWKGANPLLFLGLGYTEVAGVKKIEIEDRAYFYDNVPVVNISNVSRLVRRYDLEKIYKSIEIGYKKGVGSESESGIDDPQTKRFYNTDFSSFGVKETILCEWMAASLAIEKSRRNRIEITKDFANDEEIMVVAVTPDGSDWLPEFGTAFNLVSNLLNPDFRINIRHSATRLFKRAQAWFNGCMIYSNTQLFTFNRGEGNYEMTSQLEDTDCEAVPGTEPIIDEGADIAADTSDILFVPRIYEAESVPMSFATYQSIVANKNKALGISRTSTGHVPMHIMDLGYELFKSNANILLLQATENEL